ncbi:MAG: hypothetical protein KDB79_16075 [Acidobacteria bacterium]|nr:hypothetical protein [Acidobacteriota bacterium]
MKETFSDNSSVNLIDVILMHFRHPYQMLILRWNWKSSFLSATMRSSIFFITYLVSREGLKIALGAMAVQFIFRIFLGGVNGAIIESFSKVKPAWQATLVVPLGLACFSHTIEFVIQTFYDSYTNTSGKGKAVLISIIISIISAVFNLFVMRRGALLVKDEKKQSLWKDLKKMPQLTFDFLRFPFAWLWSKK